MAIRYGIADLAIADQPDFGGIAVLMYWEMLRNVAGHGVGYTAPGNDTVSAKSGCIVASPSYPADDVAHVDQNYVYNWTRDSAMAATELALFGPDAGDARAPQRLYDYVTFAKLCQDNPRADLAHATYTLDGQPWEQRPDPQNDGPALQTLAILRAIPVLPPEARAVALKVAQKNVDWLAAHAGEPSQNLWEERDGQSFFTLAVQRRCLTAVRDGVEGLTVPANVEALIETLSAQLDDHWQGPYGYYCSLDPTNYQPIDYDPNADIVMASVYGDVPCTDPKLLASAAAVRAWCQKYPINQSDAPSAGPLIGRYPGDIYDGDTTDETTSTGHPWMLCSANFAELYYTLAAALPTSPTLLGDATARPFFDQLQIAATTPPADAAQALRHAGDRILLSIARHSDHLALSEQVDVNTGYEKSVHDLTWSYAAFLSAVRARDQLTG
jgi:glucoamylase